MKKTKYIILLIVLFPVILYAYTLEDARFFARVYLAPAIRVERIPSHKYGTGFFTRLERAPTKLIFVTNKHMVEGDSALQLKVPIIDSNLVIRGTLAITIPLFKNTVKQYYVSQDGLDIAFVVIERSSYPALDTSNFSSFADNTYANIKNLFVGQSVAFTGYPLDLVVNNVQPLLRKGVIAGIDTIINVIYLDADAFGGSSGSPVFIDFSVQENHQFWEANRQILVGVISSYVPFTKYLINKETQKTEMIQTENSGIAVVVPAEKIRKIIGLYLSGAK